MPNSTPERFAGDAFTMVAVTEVMLSAGLPTDGSMIVQAQASRAGMSE